MSAGVAVAASRKGNDAVLSRPKFPVRINRGTGDKSATHTIAEKSWSSVNTVAPCSIAILRANAFALPIPYGRGLLEIGMIRQMASDCRIIAEFLVLNHLLA